MDGIFVNGQKATFRPEDILSGDASAYTEEIGTAVEAWMEENVTGGEQVTDTTLTLPGVPADAEKVGDELSGVKEDLSGITLGDAFLYSLGATWSQGGVNRDGEYSSWSRIRTDYIDIEALGQLTLIPPTGYAVLYVAYDSDKQYTKDSVWVTSPVTVSFANEKYIRVCFRKDPEVNLSPTEGAKLTATATYKVAKQVKDSDVAIKQMEQFTIEDLTWGIGGISNGANYSSNNKIRTSYYDVTRFGRLVATAEDGYKYLVTAYDATQTYLFTMPASGYVTGQNVIDIDENVAYIRVAFSTSDDTTLSDTSISSHFTLKAEWKAIGEINKLKYSTIDLLDGISFIRGTLDANGEFVASTSRAVTDEFISIANIKSIIVHSLIPTTACSIYFYGDFGCISIIPITHVSQEIVIPANATRMKVLVRNMPDAWLSDAAIANSLRIYKGTAYDQINNGNLLIDDYFCATAVNKKEIPTLASGTTILAFGDSITAAQDDTGWVYHFAEMTGVTIIDNAVGGSSYGHSETEDSGHWISTQIANTSSANWESASLVIVAAGTNDYGHGTPLDEIKDYVESAISDIRDNTDAPIVVITPIRRGNYLYDDPMGKLAIISGIIANAALANGCNVINGFDIPVPTYNINGLIDNMTRDGLHPTATGANVYARFIIGALM